ncbi:hypothetical protein OK016_06700 [Vibrio chagasii]|nr:hypothetical protein [Vibrio chagasii]
MLLMTPYRGIAIRNDGSWRQLSLYCMRLWLLAFLTSGYADVGDFLTNHSI